MEAYATLAPPESPAGTLNRRIRPSPMKGAISPTQGRAFPHRVCVWSTILPMTRSDTPSRSLVSSMIVPTTAAGMPTLSV